MAATVRLVVLGATLLAGCADAPPQDPVERLLHELTAAAENRDVAAVGEQLGEDFRGEGGLGKADALATFRRYLAGYDSVAVEVYDVQRAEEGYVTFRADFNGKPKDVGGLAGLLPESAIYVFELELDGENGEPKVRRASWRPWTPPPSP